MAATPSLPAGSPDRAVGTTTRSERTYWPGRSCATTRTPLRRRCSTGTGNDHGRGGRTSGRATAREMPGETSVSDYARKNPSIEPRELAKLREGNGKLYSSEKEIDVLVVSREKSGKLKPAVLEQVKTGHGDRPADAAQPPTDAPRPGHQPAPASLILRKGLPQVQQALLPHVLRHTFIGHQCPNQGFQLFAVLRFEV